MLTRSTCGPSKSSRISLRPSARRRPSSRVRPSLRRARHDRRRLLPEVGARRRARGHRDLLQDKVDAALEKLRNDVPGQVKVLPERIFLGFDAYKKVLALDDVDLVLLLTPPGFRPEMFAAAVEAGKQLFVEKPGAVDPLGVRSLIEGSGRAAQKGLSLVVGTQQRYAPGTSSSSRGSVAVRSECQVRCWPLFTWLSGDHYVEPLVHNLDTVIWVAGATPLVWHGLGGSSREARAYTDEHSPSYQTGASTKWRLSTS